MIDAASSPAEAAAIVTPQFRKNNFDLIRLFAATEVLILHSVHRMDLASSPITIALAMFPGVPIFFVLSGFLVSASLERSSDIGRFFQNRFLRIFPGLWVCLIVTVICASLVGISFARSAAGIWFALQLVGLIYTPSFLKDFGIGSYNGSLWTIPIELQFYLLVPLFYLIVRKERPQRALAVFLLFSVVAVLCAHFAPGIRFGEENGREKLLRYSFIPHFFMFMLGVFLQSSGLWRSKYIYGRGLWWLLAYIAFHYLVYNNSIGYVLSDIILGLTAISVAYTGNTEQWTRGNDISYGVYIYHGLMINILIEAGINMGGPVVLIVLVLTYIAAFASWRLVELPALKLKSVSIFRRREKASVSS